MSAIKSIVAAASQDTTPDAAALTGRFVGGKGSVKLAVAGDAGAGAAGGALFGGMRRSR